MWSTSSSPASPATRDPVTVTHGQSISFESLKFTHRPSIPPPTPTERTHHGCECRGAVGDQKMGSNTPSLSKSGFGYSGGRSRCFTFWQEFQKCYANADVAIECISQKEDYMECLHHTKEIERMKTVRDHYLSRQAHEAREARAKGEVRATSSVMRLGLIGQDKDKDKKGKDSSSSSSASSPESSTSSASSTSSSPAKDKAEEKENSKAK